MHRPTLEASGRLALTGASLAKEASERRAGQHKVVRPSAASEASCRQRRQAAGEAGLRPAEAAADQGGLALCREVFGLNLVEELLELLDDFLFVHVLVLELDRALLDH